MVVALILAHQGGWDEAFFVAAPLALFAGLLLLAKRRAEKLTGPQSEARTTAAGSEPGDEA